LVDVDVVVMFQVLVIVSVVLVVAVDVVRLVVQLLAVEVTGTVIVQVEVIVAVVSIVTVFVTVGVVVRVEVVVATPHVAVEVRKHEQSLGRTLLTFLPLLPRELSRLAAQVSLVWSFVTVVVVRPEIVLVRVDVTLTFLVWLSVVVTFVVSVLGTTTTFVVTLVAYSVVLTLSVDV